MSSKPTTTDLLKRASFNQIDGLVKSIREKLQKDMTDEDKKKIIKKIALVIMVFQLDSLYQKITDTSGIIAILQVFGFGEEKAEKIRNMGIGGINIITLAMMIFKFLREENKK